jgi:hypothetical protein
MWLKNCPPYMEREGSFETIRRKKACKWKEFGASGIYTKLTALLL